jgi:peptidoglycan hydrolase-like amidase
MLAALLVAEVLRVGVFGLFQPSELVLRSAPGQALVVEAGASRIVIEGARTLRVRVIDLAEPSAHSIHATPRGGGEFVLSVPGKIERLFRGELEITATAGVLVPVVLMEKEVAVASAVAAESPPGAPLEALMAQAVATRSYYTAARGRHRGFDFCDTTHCQFLRAPPAPSALAAIAAERTRGLVLAYRGAPIAALFSASCGGRTRALADPSPEEYPYFAVDCVYCRRGPRVHCSYCDPHAEGAGHGFGLCQTGAKGMAAAGATFREILRHYFPNTEITLRPPAGM